MPQNSASDRDSGESNASENEVLSIVSTTQRRMAITILLSLYILNFLDRQIINMLAEPIKQELNLADWQLGLLTGFAFAMFYALAGIPIARLAERTNRRNIIGISTAIWSVFTMLCGVATSYIQMLIFRFGVGVGEAGLVPPAHSLITDITPREKRASAMALFHLGVPIGSLAGLVFGGVVADLYDWRTAFIAAGAPGIILAIIVFVCLPEPRTKGYQLSNTSEDSSSFIDAVKYLVKKPSFVFATLAALLISCTLYSHQAFSPAFFFRVHGSELAEVAASFGLESKSFLGICYGSILGIGGGMGIWLSGKIADSASNSNIGNYCLVPAIALLILFPFQVAAFFSPGLVWCLILYIPGAILGACWFAPFFATIQSIAPKHMRSTASAIALLLINLIGLGIGPLLSGILSDQLAVFAGVDSSVALTWSLAIMTVFALISSYFFFKARKYVENDWEG